MPSIAKSVQLIRNMGLRYVTFRVGHEVEKKLGLFKRKFPQNQPVKSYITLNDWRQSFKFWGVQQGDKPLSPPSNLPEFQNLQEGEIPFFSSTKIRLGKNYDWLTNPDTGHRYDAHEHWSDVRDIDLEAGDIKFVWEKSRFSYIYEVIRHDFYTQVDHAEWVFNEIRTWLNANSINSGPNYKCSQEISLRILNWTYAVNYYRNSQYLSEDLFQEMMHAIFWQLKHVYANINFSRIAVRNNHAITETLTLYLAGLFFPFFPEAKLWKKKGKKWFEEEILYQVYEDGTFLQFSMNYHRVVIQLFCWAFKSADFFGEIFDSEIYERAYKSLVFLHSSQDKETGWLPNYGNNDGALFFKFSSCDYRDYRPQLNVLHVLLTGKDLYDKGDWQEDRFWFKAVKVKKIKYPILKFGNGWSTFENGGYYILREKDTLTFIRCGKHNDRPHQADNLHLDIWHNGKNVLFDGGSYKYNTNSETLKYFMGTASHNAVMLGDYDQMEKGARFIWYYWTQALKAKVDDQDEFYLFEGEITAFRHIDPKITHKRIIKKHKKEPFWIVEDRIENKPDHLSMVQYWHCLPLINLSFEDNEKNPITIKNEKGMKSEYYGLKEETEQITISTKGKEIITKIKIQ
tara:strand:- start:3857 stop:5734 length:1878 start_codon:yes stop_codon:yes gene_type:complete